MAVMYKSRKAGGGGAADFNDLTLVVQGVTSYTIQDDGIYYCTVLSATQGGNTYKNDVEIEYIEQNAVNTSYKISGTTYYVWTNQSSGFVECLAGDVISSSPSAGSLRIYKYG